MMEVTPLVAFVAGMVSVASPCILPLLPAIVASTTEGGDNRYRPLAIVLGLAVSFTLMGVVAGALGAAFGAYQRYIYVGAMFVVLVMGAWMLFDLHMPQKLTMRQSILNALTLKTYELPSEGLLSGFALGAAFGLIWLPCTGPVLATILMWVATEDSITSGALMLGVYSVGFAIPMLAIAYSTRMSARIIKASPKMIWVKRAAGFALMVVGVYMVLPYIAYV